MTTRRAPIACGVLAALVASIPLGAAAEDVSAHVDDRRWRLYAVEYARSEDLPREMLFRNTPSGSRIDMSWYFFVAVGHGRVVLVDCGTDALARPGREGLRRRWSIARAVGVVEALGRLGLEPGQVTDVVLTHFHWDHVGGLARFPEARVHVHRDEWRRVPARLRRPVEEEGRLHAFAATPATPLPGIVLRASGRHTAHHLTVRVECEEAPVLLAGDAAYFYRSARRIHAGDAARVLPGHDPALFDRHPSGASGVAAICR